MSIYIHFLHLCIIILILRSSSVWFQPVPLLTKGQPVSYCQRMGGDQRAAFVFFFFFCLLSFVVAISGAAPAAYGGSQARGPIGAVATGLRQSHSNAESEPRLQPTPQLTATPDR